MKRSKTFLLDSNVLIRSLYPGTKEQQLVTNGLKKDALVISVATLAEVLVKLQVHEQSRFALLFPRIQCKAINERVARVAALLRAQSLKTHRAYLQDCYIAATGLVYGYTLVTNNHKDFRFPDLEVLCLTTAE